MSQFYKCDQSTCNKMSSDEPLITIKGYYPNNAGGILIPKSWRTFDFCSHECAVKWMWWAMEHEQGTTTAKIPENAMNYYQLPNLR